MTTSARTFDPALPFLAYPLAVDLANSTGPPNAGAGFGDDLLANEGALQRWLAAEDHVLGDLGPAPGIDLNALRALRHAVDQLLRAATAELPLPADATRAVNAASARAPVHPELVQGGAPAASLASDAPDWQAELHGRIARSAIEVLTGSDRNRLAVCSAPSCGLLFVRTRQGQRWCSDSCGNRARVARHYHRQHGRR